MFIQHLYKMCDACSEFLTNLFNVSLYPATSIKTHHKLHLIVKWTLYIQNFEKQLLKNLYIHFYSRKSTDMFGDSNAASDNKPVRKMSFSPFSQQQQTLIA